MSALIAIAKGWLESVALFFLGTEFGQLKERANRLEAENKILKKQVDVALTGDYSPDAIAKRMRNQDEPE